MQSYEEMLPSQVSILRSARPNGVEHTFFIFFLFTPCPVVFTSVFYCRHTRLQLGDICIASRTVFHENPRFSSKVTALVLSNAIDDWLTRVCAS